MDVDMAPEEQQAGRHRTAGLIKSALLRAPTIYASRNGLMSAAIWGKNVARRLW